MNKYEIFDIRLGLTHEFFVEAKSPIEAVRQFYNNVERVKSGPIIVNDLYCYVGELKDEKAEKIKKFIKLAVESGFDCQSCRKIGIDVKKCSGDCEQEIMKFLGIDQKS